MRVMVAGATGALGKALVPQLVAAGHEVAGTTRSEAHKDAVAAAGAKPIVMDGLDYKSVLSAMQEALPDVVIHQLTSLKGAGDLKRFDKEFAATNRLRTEGTDHLLAAMRQVGAPRMVAQSYTGWPNERRGTWVKSELDPLDDHPTKQSRQTHAAIRYVEDTVLSAEGIAGVVLRYGTFYGPGTGLARGGDLVDLIQKRKLPVVGGGAGVWSFVHIEDAAAATVLATARGATGVYNVVDDEPAAVSVWLPHLAAAVGAKPPRHIPTWLAKPMIGEHGISVMTQSRGSSNDKAKSDLDWTLRYPTWREGFTRGLG
jgi:nucleoside-diphosphate-sugar epimerase